jgi:glycerol dehydrogenase-like iron-containing ADH family enzyme
LADKFSIDDIISEYSEKVEKDLKTDESQENDENLNEDTNIDESIDKDNDTSDIDSDGYDPIKATDFDDELASDHTNEKKRNEENAALINNLTKALEDCRNNVSSKNIEQIALDIIITTGLVSNFTVHQNNPDPKDDYYYNSSLAHCVYYGASLFPKCEHDHLHGEIVSFGVLCLLTYDEQFEERQRIFEFNRSIGLPCTLGEIALTEEDVPAIAHKAASVVEWTYVPGEPTEEKFIKAILDTDKAGKEFLAKA